MPFSSHSHQLLSLVLKDRAVVRAKQEHFSAQMYFYFKGTLRNFGPIHKILLKGQVKQRIVSSSSLINVYI